MLIKIYLDTHSYIVTGVNKKAGPTSSRNIEIATVFPN